MKLNEFLGVVLVLEGIDGSHSKQRQHLTGVHDEFSIIDVKDDRVESNGIGSGYSDLENRGSDGTTTSSSSGHKLSMDETSLYKHIVAISPCLCPPLLMVAVTLFAVDGAEEVGMYKCSCVYIYMGVCMRVYTCVYICVHIYVCVLVCLYVCTCVCICVYICVCMCMCDVCMCMCMSMCMCMCIYVYVCVYIEYITFIAPGDFSLFFFSSLLLVIYHSPHFMSLLSLFSSNG